MSIVEEEVSSGIPKETLNPTCAFVFDCVNEIYIWNGKECNPAQRKCASEYAQKLLSE